MTTSYQERSIAAQKKIFETDYWANRYLAALKKNDMTPDGVEKNLYTNGKLQLVWEEFWWTLPDDMSIRVEPFFMICDLCEEEF